MHKTKGGKVVYDAERIKKDADAIAVAKYIGMEVIQKGSRFYVRCPGHEKRLGKPDKQIGNCVLTDKGYFCFACREKVSTVDMVMEFTGCSYPEALETIADTCGGIDLYRMDGSSRQQKPTTLKPDDLEVIGLNPSSGEMIAMTVINATYAPHDACEGAYAVRMDDLYLVCRRQARLSIQRLQQDDEALYNRIIAEKAGEAVRRYEKALSEFGSRDAAKADIVYELFSEDGCLDSNVFRQLQQVLKARCRRAKEIRDEYSKRLV